MPNKIKQYIFLRSDLANFSTGALLAQVSHASVGAIHLFYGHEITKQYLDDLSNMTTIIYSIEEKDIQSVCSELEKENIQYYQWNENHEIITCIATRPVLDTKRFGDLKRKYKLF